ncbi:MAG: DUF2235 domain-containing protein [Planctomycetota bacterium]|jgi:uncharacterized protein (DUF2235 family)
MGKNIVLCSDGTGNTAVKGRGTNVFKLYEAVDIHGHKHDSDAVEQVAYYDDGVGTEQGKYRKAFTGAFGAGLTRNVKELYTQLARAYEPGDDIYLFGFSRGAYTVRVLGGLIVTCGIPDKNAKDLEGNASGLEGLVNDIYEMYRWRYWHKAEKKNFFADYLGDAEEDPVQTWNYANAVRYPDGNGELTDKVCREIKFIGVWDTVDAVGVPFDGLADFIHKFIYPYRFPNKDLNMDRIGHACHAIALDDERKTFHPELWNKPVDPEDAQRVEQVWFPGVHSNVGGGYPKQGVSLVSMAWMMAKAQAAGLVFRPDAEIYHDAQNATDKVYDSRSGLSVYYRYRPRDVHHLSERHWYCGWEDLQPGADAEVPREERYRRTGPVDPPKMHISLFDRIAHSPTNYAPGNLPGAVDVVATPHKKHGHTPHQLEAVKKHLPPELGTRGLLGRVRDEIRTRRACYVVLLLSTLVLLAGALYANHESGDGWLLYIPLLVRVFTPKGIAGLWNWNHWVVVVCGIFILVAWVVSHHMRKKMEKEFTSVWNPVRDLLRKSLPTAATAPQQGNDDREPESRDRGAAEPRQGEAAPRKKAAKKKAARNKTAKKKAGRKKAAKKKAAKKAAKKKATKKKSPS